jgi:N-formylglutamate deformylase
MDRTPAIRKDTEIIPLARFRFDFRQPLVCAAIHNGHSLSPDFLSGIGISGADRLREEDPFTARFGASAGNRIVAVHSRFEVDLNRRRPKAVYLEPEDAWGLPVRRVPLTPETLDRALAAYDAFYRRTESLFREMQATFGRFLVLDLHSYNHRRPGPDFPSEPAIDNPEINLGSSNIPEAELPVLLRFRDLLTEEPLQGRIPDVRLDVKFTGGAFARWTHETFPDSAVCIAVEYKKIFMDEWIGTPDLALIRELQRKTSGAAKRLLDEKF